MSNLLDNRIEEWLSPVFDTATQEAVKALAENPKEAEESFYKDLEFGTGGMRGVMGVGTNRINKYTLGKSTQGLAQYLIENNTKNENLKAVIAYDCRNNSDTLAQTVAEVLSANGIRVFLFSALRTTPELSFAVKHLNCNCGIVLTASHNPPEYNGYKVYWNDGGQLVPPQDKELITTINALRYEDIKFEANKELIELIDKDVDEAFFEASVKHGSVIASKTAKENLKVVFTPLHGTSITAIPQVLEKAGFSDVHIVKEQAEPNGNFPTVKSPNPEETEALAMATALANEINADILIGTDPDSDRLGIAVRDSNNEMILLNGNQTMVVMVDFLLNKLQQDGFAGNEFIASTIVSTPMLSEIAKSYGVNYKEVLTGFKWIAKLIEDYPELKFIGGGEESYGFMVSDFVRDKDAVTSTLLACEIAAFAKENGSSFFELLQKLYVKHGYYQEKLISLVKKGISGAEEIKQKMSDLRSNPLKEISGSKVIRIEDYLTGKATDTATGNTETIDLPKANVLIYYTEEGSKIAARPSGTEPKIKFYISVNATSENLESLETTKNILDQRIENILTALDLG